MTGLSLGVRVANIASGGSIPTFGLENVSLPDINIPIDVSVPVPDVVGAGVAGASAFWQPLQDAASQPVQ